jgi:drug/metabolite transporter (DMT)-like permease
VLGSLYPLTTILLAHVVLGERLTRTQLAGVATALVGVAVVTAA